MVNQTFTAPVAQVAAGDIKNHSSRWASFQLSDLLKYEQLYAQDRRRYALSQHFNKASALIVLTILSYGCWGVYMYETNGLAGVLSAHQWLTFVAFAIPMVGASLWLALIRSRAKECIRELDKELTEIRREIRFQKLKR